MKQLFVFLLSLPVTGIAQNAIIPRDTSFTVISTFLKEQKNYPFIQIANPAVAKSVSKAENIVYQTIGSRDLHLDIFYPSAKSKAGYPGVLLIHGGGWRSGDRSQTIPIASQLAAKGYVAVAVEYRLTLEAVYPASVFDLKAAIRWMRANATMYNLDKNKIASLGFSSGGQLAALVGTTNGLSEFEGSGNNMQESSAVQAIIDVDGILAFKHPESAEGTVAANWLGGSFEEKPATWIDASPLTHAGKNTPPALFINSSLPRFHAGRDDLIKKLEPFKIYSEIHTLPDTPHPFWFFDPWFDKVVDFMVKFLDKVFKKG